jgi:small acid-soluble spore protein F (minor alpha/beta-type SASP)
MKLGRSVARLKKKDKKVNQVLTERDRLKMEIAKELGLWEQIEREGWESLTNAACGRVGGLMRNKLNENKLK